MTNGSDFFTPDSEVSSLHSRGDCLDPIAGSAFETSRGTITVNGTSSEHHWR